MPSYQEAYLLVHVEKNIAIPFPFRFHFRLCDLGHVAIVKTEPTALGHVVDIADVVAD